jgi:hypothetical protein
MPKQYLFGIVLEIILDLLHFLVVKNILRPNLTIHLQSKVRINLVYPLICFNEVLIPRIRDELKPCISISFNPAIVQPVCGYTIN